MWTIKQHIFDVNYLNNNIKKRVRVYLPSNYNMDKNSYPVAYFHDGAAVLFGKTMFGTGSWEVLDTVLKMEENGYSGCIVVAIDNALEERPDEYLPFVNSNTNGKYQAGTFGGKAHDYTEFIVHTLKPYIDQKYRTIIDEASICGSSLGGLVTTYIISEYPNIFNKAGLFSIAAWVYEENELWDYLDLKSPNLSMKYYIYVGAKEGHISDDTSLSQKYVNDSIRYLRYLMSKGVSQRNIEFILNVNNEHNETAWSNYVESFLKF